MDRVNAANHFYLGLAQDQIGYIIGPTEAYAQIVASAPTSDNWLFNAGPTVGDHLMCAHLRIASQLGFVVSNIPPECAAVTVTDPVAALLNPTP